MFGSLVNKNARAALKEFGDQKGLQVEFEMVNGQGSDTDSLFTAVARVGEQHFEPATANTKKDAKEFAADLALRAIHTCEAADSQYGMYQGELPSASVTMSGSRYNFLQEEHENRIRPQTKKNKTSQLLAPPDKDPVMLLNEYGQKMRMTVKFEDVQSTIPGMYEAQVLVGNQTFGPRKGPKKKIARKMVAIIALEELINWKPIKQERFDESTVAHQCIVGNDEKEPSECTVPSHAHLTKEPLMVINEYCQRNKLKIEYEALPPTGPDYKRIFQCRAVVDDRTFKTGTGTTKSLAKKNAAILAMQDLFDVDIKPVIDSKKGKVTPGPTDQDPVSVLNEYGQKQKTKVEFEEISHSGPDHGRVYVVQVTVGDRVFDAGKGHSKKLAKKQAALIAMNELFGLQAKIENIDIPVESPDEKDKPESKYANTEKNCVSRLHEFCQAYHLEQPVPVEVSPEEQLNPRLHYIAFQVGQQLYDVGEGWNKKAARNKAAGLALEVLTEKMSCSKYAPIGTCEGDRFASLSWNCFAAISNHTTDAWRFAGYKVLAAFILQDGKEESRIVISLGTGNKCIGGDQLRLDGTSVNDSHAEIVARRGLVRYLVRQVELFFTHPGDPKCIFVQKESQGKLTLREGVELFLYCSTAPCGDAAIFVNGSKASNGGAEPSISKQQGLLRTKVEKGEGTIPLDWSDGVQTIDGIRRGQRLRTASCSDKIAKWNVVGVQGGLLSNFIEPIYLSAIITGTLYEQTHMARAVSGRVEGRDQCTLSDCLPEAYRVNHPTLMNGRLDMTENSRCVETKHRTNSLTVNWSVEDEGVEVYDGCLGRPGAASSQSRLSKLAIYSSLKEVIKKTSAPQKQELLEAPTYREAKELAVDYQRAKNGLYQNLQNRGLGAWELMKKPVEMSQFGAV